MKKVILLVAFVFGFYAVAGAGALAVGEKAVKDTQERLNTIESSN